MAEVFNLAARRKAASNDRVDAMTRRHTDCQLEAAATLEQMCQERAVLEQLNLALRKVYTVFKNNVRADDSIALVQQTVKP